MDYLKIMFIYVQTVLFMMTIMIMNYVMVCMFCFSFHFFFRFVFFCSSRWVGELHSHGNCQCDHSLFVVFQNFDRWCWTSRRKRRTRKAAITYVIFVVCCFRGSRSTCLSVCFCDNICLIRWPSRICCRIL